MFETRSNGVFLSVENLRGILGLLPEVGLVSIGVTVLMICGEFDLAVGSMFALMPVSIALMTNAGVPFIPAMLLGLAIAATVGFANGFITLAFNIPSFITTLGMLFIVRSLAVVLTGGSPPLLSNDLPIGVFTQFVGPGGMLRASFIWFAIIALVAAAMLGGSNFGNWIRATGGFFDAAAAMGVPVWWVKMTCFIMCAMLADFGGTIQVFRLGAPLPSIGDGLERIIRILNVPRRLPRKQHNPGAGPWGTNPVHLPGIRTAWNCQAETIYMTGISILTMFAASAIAVVVSVLFYFVTRDQQRQRRRIKVDPTISSGSSRASGDDLTPVTRSLRPAKEAKPSVIQIK